MIVAEVDGWIADNKRRLASAIGDVKAALERHAAERGDADGAVPPAADAQPIRRASPDHHPQDALHRRPAALDSLVADFGLSPFERDVLVLCAGVELEASMAELCARAQGDGSRIHPTFSLALAALPDAHWSALAPDAPLRRWRLVEAVPGGPLTTSVLRIDERVLHHLVGVESLDERLAGYLEPGRPAGSSPVLVPSHERLAHRILHVWADRPPDAQPPVVQLCGAEGASKREIAEAACASLGLRIASMRAEALPVDPRELEGLLRLCEREAALARAALVLDCQTVDATDVARDAAVAQLVEGLGCPLFLLVRERRATRLRPSFAVQVAKPTHSEQLSAWRSVVGSDRLNGAADALVSQFDLGMKSIREASAEALSQASSGDGGAAVPLDEALWDACRAQARPRLDDLAQRIDAGAGWADLVLPDDQLGALHELAVQIRHRSRVYGHWGFGDRGSRGLGISALFVGGSGTGKTLAAEVLAGELRLDLHRIDLSQVVSKYIGETEKNLRRVFDAAEDGGTVLLFDEADALFGKRTEVKDSHDRYANIEVGYLLQRMEAYRGLAVLTTNMKDSLDGAFLRRLRFIVHFPFPDAVSRAEIWRRVFPPAAPTEGLDPERLARLNVAGGNIRNIALNAAFLAADAVQPIRMTHLLKAARNEYAKLERTLTDSEVAGWA